MNKIRPSDDWKNEKTKKSYRINDQKSQTQLEDKKMQNQI